MTLDLDALRAASAAHHEAVARLNGARDEALADIAAAALRDANAAREAQATYARHAEAIIEAARQGVLDIRAEYVKVLEALTQENPDD